jgi:S1-C subfamily serine protease
MSSPAADSTDRPSGVFRWPLLWLLLLGLFLAWRMGFLTSRDGPLHDPSATQRLVSARGDLAEDEKSTIGLFQNASPSVVYITVLALHRDAFSLNIQEIPQGTGSGFVWDKQGHIVTNFHVVQKAQAAQVTLADHTAYEAQLVGAAPDKDLAVLRLRGLKKELQPIPVGSSHDLLVGQKVFAIGNPFGLDQSLTVGVVSALGREIKSDSGQLLTGLIQTDAAINPGNSGGPLLDSAGRLIGVNAAIFSPSGAFAGIGFAIPVDTVNEVIPELIRHGRIARPGLGIKLVDSQVARQLGIRQGSLILDVFPKGAAAQAGLRPTRRNENGQIDLGDIIVAIDGQAIKDGRDLTQQMGQHKVGDQIKVTVLRDGERVEIPVTLQEI